MSVLKAVSLDILIRTAPRIAKEAREWYKDLRERKAALDDAAPTATSDSVSDLSAPVEGIQSKLESLEADQARHAELISEMATQQESLSRGIQSVSTRLTILLWVSGSALVLAAASLVLALLL